MFLEPLEYQPPYTDVAPDYQATAGLVGFLFITCIIALVLRIIIAIFAAKRLQEAADHKGLSSVYGWTILLGVLSGLTGIAVIALIVMASPDKISTSSAESDRKEDGEDVQS